ncbi:MAG: HEAT repeat domain-containing protein [Cyanobacteria bacterium P01_F01_bin.3]
MVDDDLSRSSEALAKLALAQAHVDNLIHNVTEQIDLLTFDPENQELLTALVEGLSDQRDAVRLRVSEILGEIGEPATPVLTTALANHQNSLVRWGCAKSLSLIGDPSAIPALISALLNDQDTMVKGSAAGALARTGEDAVPELIKLLEAVNTSESIKGHAAWALAFIGAEAKELLYKALATDNVTVRAAVMAAIAKVAKEYPDDDNFSILINGLNDDAETVCSQAATALGDLAHKPAVPALIKLLEHPLWETRKSAILALMKIGDASVLDNLKSASLSDSEANSAPIYNLAINQLEKKVVTD